MNRKVILIALWTILACATTAQGQWALGGRIGGASGISLKKYGRGIDVEVLSGFHFDNRAEGFGLTIMAEKFAEFSDDGKFGAILGAGETMVFADEFWLGLSGTLGLEFRLGKIALQADWLPTLFFVDDLYFTPVNGGLTARWVFGGF